MFVTSTLQRAGEMRAIIEVFVPPPRESCRSLVSLLPLSIKKNDTVLKQSRVLQDELSRN